MTNLDVYQHIYQCADSIMTSDHRPILGVFSLDARIPFENIAAPAIHTGRILLSDLTVTLDVEDNFPMKKSQQRPANNSDTTIVFRAPFLSDGVSKPITLVHTNSVSRLQRTTTWKHALDVLGPFVALKSCIQHEYLLVQVYMVDETSYLRSVVTGKW